MLAIHPHPLKGESSTSWLVRIAVSNGLPLRKMLIAYIGRAPWDLDLLSDTETSRLKMMVGAKSSDNLKRTQLWRWQASLELPVGNGVQTWITTPRETRYCPRCLSDDSASKDKQSYFRMTWRLLFMTICPVHRIFLKTGCPRLTCRHSQPMKNFQHLGICSKCKSNFSQTQVEPVTDFELSCRLALCSESMLDDNAAPAEFEMFKTAREFLLALKNLVQLMTYFLLRNRKREFDSILQVNATSSPISQYHYWRSSEPITCVLIQSALQTMKECPEYATKFGIPRPFGYGLDWLGAKGTEAADHAWNMIVITNRHS